VPAKGAVPRGDVDVPGAVGRHAVGLIEVGEGEFDLCGRAVGEFEDPVVQGVGEVDVVGGVDRDSLVVVQSCERQRDRAGCARRQFADPHVRAIGDVEVAGAVDGQAVCVIQSRGERQLDLLGGGVRCGWLGIDAGPRRRGTARLDWTGEVIAVEDRDEQDRHDDGCPSKCSAPQCRSGFCGGPS